MMFNEKIAKIVISKIHLSSTKISTKANLSIENYNNILKLYRSRYPISNRIDISKVPEVIRVKSWSFQKNQVK